MADYFDTIYKAASDWNIHPALLRALIEQESGNNPAAVSKKGAVGLTQLMPDTAKALGVTDINDPEQQIWAGAKYLAQSLDAEKSPERALLRYHGGPDWQNHYGPESAAYVPAVTARFAKIAGANSPQPQPASDPFQEALKAAQEGGGKDAGQPPADASNPFGDALAAAQQAVPAHVAELAQPPGAMWNEYGISGDPAVDNAPQGPESTIDLTGAAKGAATGAAAGFKAGYGAAPPGLSAQARAALANGGLINKPGENNPLKSANEYLIVNPLSEGARILSGLMGAYQGGVAGAGEGTGNQSMQRLGRDLAALPEAFPTGEVGTGAIPHAPGSAPPTNALQASARAIFDRRDADLAARTPSLPPANPLAAAVNAPSFVPPGAVIPAPKTLPDVVNALMSLPDAAPRPDFVPPATPRPTKPAPAPAPARVPPALLPEPSAPPVAAPKSVGAASSRDLSPPGAVDLTPAQVQAYRSTAEGQKLLEPQQPGVADPNIYVPGVTPNSAEIEQSVNTARELKMLNASAPDVSQEAKDVASVNNDARQRHFAGIAGSPVDVANARAARDAQAEKDLAAAFGDKNAADAAPVADTIRGILSTPRGRENTALQQFVRPLLDRLHNADGTLKSDPEQLYGIREDIARMQTRAAKAETPTLDHVNGQLQDIKTALDEAIEQGAPGYKQYLENYSAASRPIDAMEALQGFEKNLYGTNNQMQYSRVQNMMKQIVDARAAPGLNQFKSIPDEMMERLWALRDDLRRSASAQELARTPGSDTAQNMMDFLKGVGRSGANLAAHATILSHTGPVGNLLFNATKGAVSARAANKALAKQTARGMQILHPDPSILRNPLQPDR